jgi:inositol-phosphate phosphatase / L-galactose 1-phosphate phosphatase / histidinol-phosphatase
MTELTPLTAFANNLADEAAKMLAQHVSSPLGTTMKADKTFVTSLDLAIESRLRELISAAFPDHGIWGEEFAALRPDAEWVWTLDPIDGMMAFVVGMPVYSTLIALCRNGIPVVGIMNFPATGERWTGQSGAVTTLNGSPCRTRSNVALPDAIMSASSPDFFMDDSEKLTLNRVVKSTAWRIYGGAAMSHGQLSSGRTDLALDAGLKIYDYAPFVPIIEGAGGVITDWHGKRLHLRSGSRILAAGSKALHAQALNVLRKH